MKTKKEITSTTEKSHEQLGLTATTAAPFAQGKTLTNSQLLSNILMSNGPLAMKKKGSLRPLRSVIRNRSLKPSSLK